MDTSQYKQDQNFDRNQAIFVLSYFDHQPIEKLSQEFKLSISEIQKIITTHTEYMKQEEYI